MEIVNMPPRDIDDCVDPWFNRFMHSVRYTFLSGVFGCVLTICSFLAIPFAATLPYYNTAIIVCVFIGFSFLMLCLYCCRAWFRLSLSDFLYRYRQPQRIPRFDSGNKDTLMDSKCLPTEGSGLLKNMPKPLDYSSFSSSESNPMSASTEDAACNTSKEYSDEVLPSPSAQSSPNTAKEFSRQSTTDTSLKNTKKIRKEKVSGKTSYLEKEVSSTIDLSSIDPKVHYKPSALESSGKTSETTDISEGREPFSDESISSESGTRSIGSVISHIIANLPIYHKVLNETSSDLSSLIENDTPECKKDASSTSGSLVDSEKKTKSTDSSILKPESSGRNVNIKRSSSEKDISSASKGHFVVEIHDSSKSGKQAAGDFARSTGSGRARSFSAQEELPSSELSTFSINIPSSSRSRDHSATEDEYSKSTEVPDV